MSATPWLVIFFLVAANALYVAAEFAAVSVRHSRIRQMAEDGNRLAVALWPYLQDPHQLDRYIAACQIGITLSSLVLGAFGQATVGVQLAPLLARWGGLQPVAAQSTSAIIVLVGLTVFQVVFGELVPKSLALRNPTQIALLTLIPMQWSLTLYSWSIAFLNGSGIKILQWMGVPQTGHRHIHSPEEIDLLIAESRDGGLLEPDEQKRLHRALQLGIRPARQLMVPRPQVSAISVDTPSEEALLTLVDSPYSRLPVYRDTIDHVVGLLHIKDVVLRYVEEGRVPPIEQVMRPVLTVHENLTADRLLTLMRERKFHQAVVVDEFGGFAGFVTLDDVLEEVLGEVADEFKTAPPEPEPLPDGRVRLPGALRLDEVEPWIGVYWQGEADTVAGYIINHLGRLPRPGERIQVDGVELEIERVENHTVMSVVATPVAVGEEEPVRG